LRTRIILRSLY